MEFRWIEWNVDHIAKHGIESGEVEDVVRHARRPFPQSQDDGRWLVWGRGQGGRYLQVVYVLDDDGTLFVIHARPLTHTEKRRLRRMNR